MKKQLRVAALLGALASGCVTTPPAVGDPAPVLKDEAAEKAYQEVLNRYSARAELYEGFDTRLFVATTFQTPAYREARVLRRAQFQHIPEPKVKELLAQEQIEAAQTHEFFLAVHTNDYRWDDFDKRNSIWRIALLTPAGEIRPSSVRRVGRVTLDMRAIYPYMADFWVAYQVFFPITFPDGRPVIPADAASVTLQVASTLGTANLTVAAR
ncbi:hypothetical protein P2318_13070 [Myxococcaceae bacterium GXIMD 01537]